MNAEDLARLKKWFSEYTGSFQSRSPEHREAYSLKVDHTDMVCKNMLLIAKEQRSMTDEKLLLAEAVALLHDVGRFPQYERYGTFNDRVSINHGKLGAEVIVEEGPIDGIPERERKLIMDTVRFHNTLKLPSLSKEALFFLKLVRDADKLDIWRVMIDAYGKKDSSPATFGLPESPECSGDIVSAIMERRMAQMSKVRTVNDLKLVHLSWVFELNFAITYKLLLERKYIRKAAATLPRTGEILAAVSVVEEFAREKQVNV